jgi:hypothetical protein
VTPAKRGKGGKPNACEQGQEQTPGLHELGATFETGVQHRRRDLPGIRWGGADHCIEEPEVIEKILTQVAGKGAVVEAPRLPPCRAPPQAGLFD